VAFRISKDINPDKISGYTYQGLPIVIGKKRGRPPKTKAKPTWYPMEKKVHAACLYAVTGNFEQVSKLVDIPTNQLKSMANEQWWDDVIKQVRHEENDQLTAKMTTFIDKSIDAMLERLENGDRVVNLKTGEIYSAPVRLRDMAIPVGILIDKRNLLRGEATSRTERLGQEEALDKLGKRFEAFAKKLNIKEPEVIDVQPNEVQNEDEEQVREVKEGQGTTRDEGRVEEGGSVRPEATEGEVPING